MSTNIAEEGGHQHPDALVRSWLKEKSRTFHDLAVLQDEIWKLPEADQHFANQRTQADNADRKLRDRFFQMMQDIGDELQRGKHIVPADKQRGTATRGPFRVLDLCMAPGGYSATVLKYCPSAQICGITLAPEDGGHEMLLDNWSSDARVRVDFLDLTMLATELQPGVPLPDDYPDLAACIDRRPFADVRSFDLVFCDGQVLRTHTPSTRSRRMATRLTTAQLILALQRISSGGTAVVLLHKLGSWRNVQLLQLFSKFADIELFKPKRHHASRGSFYLVAKNVNPAHPDALRAVELWKWTWWKATVEDGCGADYAMAELTSIEAFQGQEDIERTLEEFGSVIVQLGEPIWNTQKEALERATYTRKANARGYTPRTSRNR